MMKQKKNKKAHQLSQTITLEPSPNGERALCRPLTVFRTDGRHEHPSRKPSKFPLFPEAGCRSTSTVFADGRPHIPA